MAEVEWGKALARPHAGCTNGLEGRAWPGHFSGWDEGRGEGGGPACAPRAQEEWMGAGPQGGGGSTWARLD
jgi:hypothetical protein